MTGTRTGTDYDAVVIGAGHNGLVCATYLAKGGLRTLLLEARDVVGGTAGSESFGGATVNICNCDHLTFRTTPVMDELQLAGHGLRYVDVEPGSINMAWSGGPAWIGYHDVERTLDGLSRSYPGEVDGYRRYLKAAMPAVRLILDAANDPPSLGGFTKKVLAKRGRGVSTAMRWSRRSAADVLREFFTTDALQGPAIVTGPMVWGISPEFAGSGLGALTYAFRHVSHVGRPVGGSGMVPTSLLAAFESYGGVLRTASPVAAITCEGERIRGVRLRNGDDLRAPIVVSACNPHDTFLHWLQDPPPQAKQMVDRWRTTPHADGYESKVDAVLSAPPRLKALIEQFGDAQPIGTTLAVAPSLAEIHRGYEMMSRGEILDQPGLLCNVPSAIDATMAPADRHVFSLEALFTPYGFTGGWQDRDEPYRWLQRYADLVEPGFLDSIIDWRAMTPMHYERDFHLPHGHATSFAGGPLAALRNAAPELTRYETPVRGLYLTGAATFPGAGVWGASGRNAALKVLSRV
jgi:beta-carotene ketolase (CrtO type)